MSSLTCQHLLPLLICRPALLTGPTFLQMWQSHLPLTWCCGSSLMRLLHLLLHLRHQVCRLILFCFDYFPRFWRGVFTGRPRFFSASSFSWWLGATFSYCSAFFFSCWSWWSGTTFNFFSASSFYCCCCCSCSFPWVENNRCRLESHPTFSFFSSCPQILSGYTSTASS